MTFNNEKKKMTRKERVLTHNEAVKSCAARGSASLMIFGNDGSRLFEPGGSPDD